MTTLDEIRARLAKAKDMVACLCLPQSDSRSRDWIMSIPARPDHDPDLVIAAALDDVAFLLGEVERLTNAREAYWKDAEAQRERAERAERERDAAVANAYEVGKRDGASAQRERDAGVFRAIELTVDGLNTRAFQQKPETQAALDRIKAHCREAIRQQDKGEPG
jgi:flagellar biosynthesis/type III secretory pathway protein FliH